MSQIQDLSLRAAELARDIAALSATSEPEIKRELEGGDRCLPPFEIQAVPGSFRPGRGQIHRCRMTKLKRHPLSELFSRYDLAGEDAEDIKDNGLQMPITLLDGMILDGWNRYQACQVAKVTPVYMPLSPGQDPWTFVKSINMPRRHMRPAERLAVMLLKLQMDGKDDRSKLTTPTVREIEKEIEVSHGTAVKGAQVARANDPALTQALADGRISLDRAAEVAKLPKRKRKAAIEAPPEPRSVAAIVDQDELQKLRAENAKLKAELADLQERHQETIALLEGAQSDIESMERVINADNRLTAMIAENKRFREEARIERTQKNGLMVGNHDLAGKLKAALRKVERLEKGAKVPEDGDDLLETRDEPSYDEVES